jgi:hypothetical protein
VNRLVIYKSDLTTYPIENIDLEPPSPIGPNARGSKIVPNMNDVVIQIYMSSGSDNIVVSRSARLDNTVVLITLQKTDTDDGTGKGTDDEDSTVTSAGGLRVFNNYWAGVANAPDMKIFKFILYKKNADGTYILTPAAYTWNGTGIGNTWIGGPATVTSTYNPILRARNENIYNLPQGYYKLVIVASTFPWELIRLGTYTIPGTSTPLTEALISYDCGDVLITENIERQYYFNVATGKEKDVPQGYVELYIAFTGLQTGTDYHPASFVEIMIPKNGQTTAGALSSDQTKFEYWPGTWGNLNDGPYVTEDYLVFLYRGVIGYSQTVGPYYIPPGYFLGRYGDSWGSNGRIYGNGRGTYWRRMDMKDRGGQRAYVQLDPSLGVAWN